MKILLTGAYKYTEGQLSRLKALGADFLYVEDEREELSFDVSAVDAVVCNGLFLYNDIKKFKNLKFIQLTSAGLDRVPAEYIKSKNISLFNARGVYSVPMAEVAVLGTLLIYKKSFFFRENQKNHVWQKNRELFELCGKTVVTVGCGSVGSECARRYKALGCRVLGVDLYPTENELYEKIYPLSVLPSVLSVSDAVILTLPLTDETRGLFIGEMLSHMKNTAVLINISRGAVVDEDALTAALSEKKLYGAVLDVFESEPLSQDSPLWDMENVVITPHNSFVSEKNSERLFSVIYGNLSGFLKGDKAE